MKTIEVQQDLEAPIERVFAIFADHGGYGRFRGIKAAELTREGTREKNGEGAQRKIELGSVTLWEDILAYEENALIEYRIVKAKPNLIHHELGRQRFERLPNGGTRVHWTSTFKFRIPVVGRFLEPRAAAQFQQAFAVMLRTVEKMARA
ncbi:MAG: SRPBCC family protein [Myxococcales bacterium]|nr:SRPBCC family protein [Myxococcales bacterium]MDH3843911.1 SRPBCC family protein [Myxococcales bacterium]